MREHKLMWTTNQRQSNGSTGRRQTTADDTQTQHTRRPKISHNHKNKILIFCFVVHKMKQKAPSLHSTEKMKFFLRNFGSFSPLNVPYLDNCCLNWLLIRIWSIKKSIATLLVKITLFYVTDTFCDSLSSGYCSFKSEWAGSVETKRCRKTRADWPRPITWRIEQPWIVKNDVSGKWVE